MVIGFVSAVGGGMVTMGGFVWALSDRLAQQKGENDLRKLTIEELTRRLSHLETAVPQVVRSSQEYTSISAQLRELAERCGRIENTHSTWTGEHDDEWDTFLKEQTREWTNILQSLSHIQGQLAAPAPPNRTTTKR